MDVGKSCLQCYFLCHLYFIILSPFINVYKSNLCLHSHTIKKTDPDYRSEMQKSIDEGSSFKKARVVPPKPISHLRKSYNSALAREARENNMAYDVGKYLKKRCDL